MNPISERSFVFDAQDGDRSYAAADFARVLESLAGRDGVIAGIDDELEVTASSPAAMTVEVSLGSAWIQGRHYNLYSAAETLTIPAADATNPRIDRIVVRLDLATAARTISVQVKEGTPAATPSAPSLERNSTAWEISLAQVAVAAGATSITDANITDERGDSTLCGFVAADQMIVADVTLYGATGDGVTDDTAAVNRALATGETVYFPPGDYVVSDLEITTEGQILLGAGQALTTLIAGAGSAHVVTWSVNGVRIENMSIDPNSIASIKCLYQLDAWWATVRNVRIVEANLPSTGWGAYIESSLAGTGSYVSHYDTCILSRIKCLGVDLTDAVTTITFTNVDAAHYSLDAVSGLTINGGSLQDKTSDTTLLDMVADVRNVTLLGLDIEGVAGITAYGFGTNIDKFFTIGTQWEGFSGTKSSGTLPTRWATFDDFDTAWPIRGERAKLSLAAAGDIMEMRLDDASSIVRYELNGGAYVNVYEPGGADTLWAVDQLLARGGIQKSTSRRVKNLSGRVTISDTDSTAAVAFGTAEPDTNYTIVLTSGFSAGTPAADSLIAGWSNKATTGFTVRLGAAPGAGNSVEVGWVIIGD